MILGLEARYLSGITTFSLQFTLYLLPVARGSGVKVNVNQLFVEIEKYTLTHGNN